MKAIIVCHVYTLNGRRMADEEKGKWLIEVQLVDRAVLFGFQSEDWAVRAFDALSTAMTLESGATIKLQSRDENGNWIIEREAELP